MRAGGLGRRVPDAAARGMPKRTWCAAVAALALAICAIPLHAALHIHAAPAPAFFDLRLGALGPMLDANGSDRQLWIQEMSRQIAQATSKHPGELLVLRPADFSITYDRAPHAARKMLAGTLGATPAATYETAVASVLHDLFREVRAAAADAQLSVLGLPLESANAETVNARYAGVLAWSSALVSSRSLILSGVNDTEPAALRRTLPAALSLANGREIYYRCNGDWRHALIVNSPGAVDIAPMVINRRSDVTKLAASTAKTSAAKTEAVGNPITAAKPLTARPQDLTVSAKPAPASTASSGGSGSARGGAGGGVRTARAGGNNGSGAFSGPNATIGATAVTGYPNTKGMFPTAARHYQEEDEATDSPFPYRIFVTEQVSDSVKAIYPQVGAKDSITIYQEHIDPNNDGIFDEEALVEGINTYVPTTYKGPACLDWEGYGGLLLYLPVGTPGRDEQIEEFVRALRRAKELRPLAKWGYYTLPFSSMYDYGETWHNHALSLKPIFDVSDCLFPSVYRVYGPNEPYNAQDNATYVKNSVTLALEMANGKPVYPYMWPRYHPFNPVLAYKLIAGVDFKHHCEQIFKAKYQGRRVKGVVWWGSDHFFWWVATMHPHGTGGYTDGPLLLQVLGAEMAPGETPAQHFTRIHKRTLRQLADVIANAPLPNPN